MTRRKYIKNLIGHLRDLLIVILIGNLVSFLFNMDFDNFFERLALGSLYSLFIGGFLWKGNQYIGFVIGKKMNINKSPLKVLWWNLSAMFIYSVTAIVVVNYIWFVLIFNWTPGRMFTAQLLTMLIELIITVVITSIFFSAAFFRSWRESAVNEERLKKESISLQYKALKNQVNPHFLFNSLNSLSSLVYKDQDLAVKFIKQLSEVYRYVLEHKENELVTLAEEVSFSEKYVYLQKIRHEEGLKFSVSLRDMNSRLVVPVSLQILIENAIKHNVIAEDIPLYIDIFDTDEAIVVRNNLQPRKALKESGGIGLSTIKARYSFLSDRKVITRETKEHFIVELPIIERPDARADH